MRVELSGCRIVNRCVPHLLYLLQRVRGRSLIRSVLLIATFVSLTACTTLGPDYQEPDVDWLAQWETTLYGEVEQSVADPNDVQRLGFWWETFNDPVLNSLILSAREANPSLRIAALNIARSRALLGIAVGTQYPQVQQGSGSAARVDNWPTEGDDSGDRSGLYNYNLGFDLGWELDFWGRFERSIESADAAFFASIANQRNAQVLVSAQVAQTYFAYLTTTRQIQIAQMNADLQLRSLEITRQLYDSGQDSELDLQQANTQFLATSAAIPGLEATQQQLANALTALLGRRPGDLPELAGPAQPLPKLAPGMIDQMPARLMMRRPDVRVAAFTVAAQSAQIGVAEADLYPSISLFGTIGWGGNTADGSTDSLSTGFGPAFTWNLFNYGRLENAVRVQDASLEQAIEQYQATVLQAAREIDDAAITVVKTREQDAMLKDALASSERALKIANTRYREGYSDFQRVLDAQRALANQSTSYVANQGAHASAVVDFYRAMGGGWKPVELSEALPAETIERMESRTDWDGQLREPLPQNEPETGETRE